MAVLRFCRMKTLTVSSRRSHKQVWSPIILNNILKVIYGGG